MKVLVLDPDESSRDAVRRGFAAAGGSVRVFSTLAEADRALVEHDPDVVVAALESGSGTDLVRQLRGGNRSRIVYALVDSEDLERAVESGADDFLWRPVSAGRVGQLATAAAARRQTEASLEETRLRLASVEVHESLPGRSPGWISALASLERAAASGASVLLTGESGTEKDAAALAIHRLSPRGAGRLIYISEGESLELATRQARPGTLFLPSVEATSAGFQEAVLRQLEGTARFIVALDEAPREALEAGRLLPRLYDALAGHTVHLPPLREREGDVALLARRFLDQIDPALSLDPDALDALQAHDWPGNTRELAETVRRAARISEDVIGPTVVRSVLGRPLPRARMRQRKAPVVRIAVGDSLADVERRLISKTLEFARGNKKKTAELLKLSLKTIYNKIKEYGLEH